MIEPDDTEEDPEVDDHSNEDVCFHFLNSNDVVHKLEERCELEPHEDLSYTALSCVVKGRVLWRQLFRLSHQLVKDERTILSLMDK